MTVKQPLCNYDGDIQELAVTDSLPGLYFTDERSQNAVGGILTGSLVYSDTDPSIKLDGDENTPSVSKYYGTNASGVKGYFSLPVSPEPGASKSFAIAMAIALG